MSKMILADFHHDSLWRSLEYLFEKRLGHQLFRPTGMEWFPEFWGIAEPYGNDIRTANQYLRLRFDQEGDGYYVLDGIRGLTMEQFKQMPIDVLIASVPQNVEKYARLIKEFKPNAKLIYQVGNDFGEVNFGIVKNFLASTAPINIPSGVNAVFYHQEFDLNVYNYEPPKETKVIRSFVHTLMAQSHFQKDWQDFLELEKELSEFKMESYGSACRDGCVMGDAPVSRMMKESQFGFNLKSGGDGYGHVIHSWFAVGRPVIVRSSQYREKLAGQLMSDKTCIDLDKGTMQQNAERIKKADFVQMGEAAYKRFKEVVDFDEEEKRVRKFLENLR